MNKNRETERQHELIEMVRSSKELMAALLTVRELRLTSWCIGAGAIRSMVWDKRHAYQNPTPLSDVDVVYFDASADAKRDKQLEMILKSTMPGVSWEVTNQANIHHWFLSQLSQEVPPITSLTEGVATWPEYATCVGVALEDDDRITVIAPFGLLDLFEMRLRHNPTRASKDVFLQRIAKKKLLERWPLVSLIDQC